VGQHAWIVVVVVVGFALGFTLGTRRRESPGGRWGDFLSVVVASSHSVDDVLVGQVSCRIRKGGGHLFGWRLSGKMREWKMGEVNGR
jgi:hypothetical protein